MSSCFGMPPKWALGLLTLGVLCASPMAALAQTQSEVAPDSAAVKGFQRAGAADAAAVVPMVVYRSALTDVRSLVSPDVKDWRQSNEIVTKYLDKNAAQRGDARQPGMSDATGAMPSQSSHQGHQGK